MENGLGVSETLVVIDPYSFLTPFFLVFRRLKCGARSFEARFGVSQEQVVVVVPSRGKDQSVRIRGRDDVGFWCECLVALDVVVEVVAVDDRINGTPCQCLGRSTKVLACHWREEGVVDQRAVAKVHDASISDGGAAAHMEGSVDTHLQPLEPKVLRLGKTPIPVLVRFLLSLLLWMHPRQQRAM